MRNAFLGLLIATLSVSFGISQEADDLVGVWMPSEGTAMVKIEKIGSKYFGRIVWLKEPNDEDGNPKTDKKNPDENLHSTPLKGYRILKDFVWNPETKLWEDGTIYDPKNGTTYSCKIEQTEENRIEVRGFVGAEMFGRTDVWTKMKKKG